MITDKEMEYQFYNSTQNLKKKEGKTFVINKNKTFSF